MSIAVDKNTCVGCFWLDEPRCVQACPGDLMALGTQDGKAYIRDDRDCWDCMACVKACPVSAIDLRLSYVIADYRATLTPRGSRDHITWICIDSAGNREEFIVQTKAEIKPEPPTFNI